MKCLETTHSLTRIRFNLDWQVTGGFEQRKTDGANEESTVCFNLDWQVKGIRTDDCPDYLQRIRPDEFQS